VSVAVSCAGRKFTSYLHTTEVALTQFVSPDDEHDVLETHTTNESKRWLSMNNNMMIMIKETVTSAPNSLTQCMKLLTCIQKRLVRISAATPAILTAAFRDIP
jgi:hypothetical protein